MAAFAFNSVLGSFGNQSSRMGRNPEVVTVAVVCAASYDKEENEKK